MTVALKKLTNGYDPFVRSDPFITLLKKLMRLRRSHGSLWACEGIH